MPYFGICMIFFSKDYLNLIKQNTISPKLMQTKMLTAQFLQKIAFHEKKTSEYEKIAIKAIYFTRFEY